MERLKFNYFNTYEFTVKFFLLIILYSATVNCGTRTTKKVLQTENYFIKDKNAVNINTASVAELEKLPGIGAKRAAAIVKYREKFGAFRQPEHLLLVEGISDKKFRAMSDLVTIR